MLRIRTVLLGLLAMMAVSLVASSTALAVVEGPWWRHPVGAEQVKFPENEEHYFESVNQSPFILKGEVGSGKPTKVTLECQTVKNGGTLWNGAHQGQDQAKVKFSNCSVTIPVKCTAEVLPVEVYTELMWKYKGVTSELTEKPNQQKIFDVFAPTAAPGENGHSIFTTIKLPAACGVLTGTFFVEAAGTKSEFTDQQGHKHPIVWGTAAEVAPQDTDVETLELVWYDPNVTLLHHQETSITARLLFGGNPAELQGQIAIKLAQGGKFGAYKE